MSTSKAIREQVERCRWFTAEEAVQWALASYYAAVRGLDPPEGEAWEQDGAEWSDSGLFSTSFMDILGDRIFSEALARGIVSWSEPISFEEGCEDGGGDFAAVQDHELPPAKNPGNNASELGADGAS